MGVLYADLGNHSAFPGSLRQVPPSSSNLNLHDGLRKRVEDVVITSEFWRRKTRPENPTAELSAFKHLANFLSSEPLVVLSQLASVLVQVCDAGSAGITLEERRSTKKPLQCVGAAGQLATAHLDWIGRNSPCGTVIDTWRAELFRRPKRSFATVTQGSVTIEELLVIPWELSSGRRGAIWLAQHDPHSRFNPEDFRLVTTLSDFTRHALQRSHSEEKRRSCETLASAARLANQLAHEINNPLQGLMNSLYLVPRVPDDEHLGQAQVQAGRVVELVRSVLEIKREPDLAMPSTTQDLALR